MSKNEIVSLIETMNNYDELASKAKAKADAIRDTIKAAMGDCESVQAGEYKITWKAVTASRIDTTALKKALPEVAERFTKTTTARRFCVA